MLKYAYRFLGQFILLHLISIGAIGQANDSAGIDNRKKGELIFSIGAGIQHGFIFAHSPAVENTKGAHPTGAELSFAWQKNDTATWNLCNCFPKNGLLISYYDYDVNVLGHGVQISYFLEPVYKLGKKTFFSLRGVAGLAYLTNPYDSIHNPSNQSYSSAVGGYLLLGVGFSFALSNHWWLNATANYQHISNGGLRLPNKGINWPTAGLALIYQKNPRSYLTAPRYKEKFWRGYSPRWDLGIFGMAIKGTDENGNKERMPLIGVSFQVGKQVGRINMLTAGAEVYTDKSLEMQLKRDSIDASAVRAGLLLGHEFLLGKFLFSQQLGVYIFNQTPYYDAVYHRWGVHYRIDKHWGVGFKLKAHRQVADFIDLRLTYSWQNKGNMK